MSDELPLHIYIAESRELLDVMEATLLKPDSIGNCQASLQEIFRAAHTIKGSAGLFGLDEIVAFTHGVESLLDQLREGKLTLNKEITELLLACRDHISKLVDKVEFGMDDHGQASADIDLELNKCGEALTQRISAFGVGTRTLAHTLSTTSEPALERLGEVMPSDNLWHISLDLSPNCLCDGMDPLSFLRYLGTLGRIVDIKTSDSRIPDAAIMDPEILYLHFELQFVSDADKQTIESVFAFVRDDSDIRIQPPLSRNADYVAAIKSLPEENLPIGDILVRSGSLTHSELDEALQIQADLKRSAQERRLGNIVVDKGMIAAPVLEAAIEKQSEIRETKARENQSIRVDSDKLDNLINLIGEMVIAGAGTALNAQALGDSALLESISTLTRLVEEVRDSALRLRMVQIGATFNRFQRVVHDVSKELGKDIELVITGAETELDKAVIEKIGDPLMHLVRNAIDHGIEPAAVRLTKGKPATAKLHLHARHDSGCIVIEVSDDGAGLNRDRILQKGIDRGLVQAGQAIDDADIYNLIFEPGFSTAQGVTNLSGRGVGMDVVKSNIAALRGTVELETYPDEGTLFRVRMPLTLAIIDGFLVGVDTSSFVVPLDMVLECVELNSTVAAQDDRDYINLRGELLPFIRLRSLFELGGEAPKRENLVVVNASGTKVGLVVDRLMGEFQTVIKPLGSLFKQVRGVGGSTILGNGEVALILDIPSLVDYIVGRGQPVSRAA